MKIFKQVIFLAIIMIFMVGLAEAKEGGKGKGRNRGKGHNARNRNNDHRNHQHPRRNRRSRATSFMFFGGPYAYPASPYYGPNTTFQYNPYWNRGIRGGTNLGLNFSWGWGIDRRRMFGRRMFRQRGRR